MPLDPAHETIEILHRLWRFALDNVIQVAVEIEAGEAIRLQDRTRLIRKKRVVDRASELWPADQPRRGHRRKVRQADDLAVRIGTLDEDARGGRHVEKRGDVTEHDRKRVEAGKRGSGGGDTDGHRRSTKKNKHKTM